MSEPFFGRENLNAAAVMLSLIVVAIMPCFSAPSPPWFAIHVNSDASLAIERDFAVAIASEARKVSQELAKQREYMH